MRNLAILEVLAPHFELEILTLVHHRDRLADPGPVAQLGKWTPVLARHRRSPCHRLVGQIDYQIRGRGWERESWFLGSRDMARAVEEKLRTGGPDLVHTAYWYTLRQLASRPRPPLWALDTHDVQIERWQRLHGRVASNDRSGEERELSRNDVVIAITPHDAEVFRGMVGPEARIETIGMGIDLKRWSRAALTPQRRSESIVYYGNMAAEMNVRAATHLCREILPEVRKIRPDTQVVILGADPHPDVRHLSEIPGVRITGTVDDPRAILASCGVFALCMRAASGIRSRACEAMALEVPIVAYPESLEGMGFEEERDYLSALDARGFAMQIDRLLKDEALSERLTHHAHASVADRYGIEATYGQFVHLYRELLA